MRILFLTEDASGPSTRYRVRQFLPALADRGVRFEVEPIPAGGVDRRALLDRAADFDRVFLQRRLLNPLDARRLARRARHLTFDFDDAILFPDSTTGRRRSLTRAVRFRCLARHADLRIAGSRGLAELAAPFGRTEVVPTVVDPGRYEPRPPGTRGALRLAWIGSRSTLPFLEDVLPGIEPAARDAVDLELHVIADVAPRRTALPIVPVTWSEEGEAAALAACDVGLAPLRDDRWCRGKCGLRLLQYFAAELATVASPVGGQAEILHGGRFALEARDARGFGDAVRRLAHDPELRAELARAGRRRLEQAYSLEHWRSRFVDLVTGEGER